MVRSSKYPQELRERAVALVFQYEREQGDGRGAMARVARDLGVHKEALVRREALDIEGGGRPLRRAVAAARSKRSAA
jgi:transposase